MIARRINAPWPYWRYFNLPVDRDLDKALAEIRQIINSFIAQARSRLAQNPELAQQPTNFLEAMLAWHDEGEAQFTDDEIFGNVFTMLLAGEDTTANTMTWMMHYMAVYPDVQRQMQAEVDAILGDADLPEDIKVAEKLPYIEAVAQETMRLKPVAPLYFLETNQDVTVAGVQISKGTAVTLLARPGVMDQSNFEHAHEFRPERWLSGCPFHGAHNRAAHVPFGSGPRLCPGRSLALLEIKTAMAMICHHFDVTQVGDPQQVRERFAFAMMPTGLSVQFNPRRRDIAD